jgi:hypothetical protein
MRAKPEGKSQAVVGPVKYAMHFTGCRLKTSEAWSVEPGES